MENFDWSKYKRAFVFGTGGGNDIVSAIIPALYLQKKGLYVDVGGVLSPGAIHKFDSNPECVVNKIVPNTQRFLPFSEMKKISFIDSMLPGITGMNCDFYDISIRFGTDRLTRDINDFIELNGYDLVLGVDVGGDILGKARKDRTLLSPVMDFTSLYLLGKMNVDSMLLEFGLGTDGELRPVGMSEIINELKRKKLMLDEGSITSNDSEIERFRGIFDKIKEVRAGHTAAMTLQTLDTKTPDTDISTMYRFRSQVGKTVIETPYKVILPHQFFGKTFLIDAKGLAKQRKENAFAYDNPLDQYVRLKSLDTMWKTELDLMYLWSSSNWTNAGKGKSLLLLSPSEQIERCDRIELICEGISLLKTGECDSALVLREDLENICETGLVGHEAGRFCVVAKEEDSKFAKKVARQVFGYYTYPLIKNNINLYL